MSIEIGAANVDLEFSNEWNDNTVSFSSDTKLDDLDSITPVEYQDEYDSKFLESDFIW